MRVYLAGPDVFFPAPEARAAALKAVCARYGLVGVSPLDALEGEPAEWLGLAEARRIALRNEAHMGGCAALIANLTPFRGPSADVGTVYELGYMRALGRPVFGWSNCGEAFEARTLGFLGAAARRGADGGWRDAEGLLVEGFGLADNLMIEGGILGSGGEMFVAAVEVGERWRELGAFEACVAAVGRRLLGG